MLASLGLLLVPMFISFVFGGLWYGCHRRRQRLSRLGEDNTVGEHNLFKAVGPSNGSVSMHEISVSLNNTTREDGVAEVESGEVKGLQKKRKSRPRLDSESEIAM